MKPVALESESSKGFVFFSHPDYIDHRIEDVYALAPKEREALRIVLETGHKVTGTVFDVAGKPVPNAMVKAVRKDWYPSQGDHDRRERQVRLARPQRRPDDA